MSRTAWTWTARITDRGATGTMYEVAQEFPGLHGAWWTVWVPNDGAILITGETMRVVSASSKLGCKILRTVRQRFPYAKIISEPTNA